MAHYSAILLTCQQQLSLCLMCSLLLQAAAEQAAILTHRPQDLKTLLEQLGLEKWLPVFEREEVNLQLFLSLTDDELKEVGIK